MSTTSLEIKVPFIVTCQVTGLQKAYTSKEFVARKIANYGGDVQAMLDTYVCKDAKKLLREGKTVAEVIAALGGTKDAASVDVSKLVLVKKVKVVKVEKPAEVPASTETPAPAETPAASEEVAVQAAAKKTSKSAPKAKTKKAKKVKEVVTATETPRSDRDARG